MTINNLRGRACLRSFSPSQCSCMLLSLRSLSCNLCEFSLLLSFTTRLVDLARRWAERRATHFRVVLRDFITQNVSAISHPLLHGLALSFPCCVNFMQFGYVDEVAVESPSFENGSLYVYDEADQSLAFSSPLPPRCSRRGAGTCGR